MKNFVNVLAVVMTVMSFNAFADECLVGRSIDKDNLDSIEPSTGETCFEKVWNKNGGTIAKGNVVIVDTTEDDGYTVATSATAGAVPRCVMAESCANGKLCKCQTYGYADFIDYDSDNGVATVGTSMFISENNAGYVQSELLGSIAASDAPVGVFLETKSASADIKGFIRLR